MQMPHPFIERTVYQCGIRWSTKNHSPRRHQVMATYVLPTPCRLGRLPAQQGSQSTAHSCWFLKSCLPGVPLCSAIPVWDDASQICLFTLPYRDLLWDSKARKWTLDSWSSISIAQFLGAGERW